MGSLVVSVGESLYVRGASRGWKSWRSGGGEVMGFIVRRLRDYGRDTGCPSVVPESSHVFRFVFSHSKKYVGRSYIAVTTRFVLEEMR